MPKTASDQTNKTITKKISELDEAVEWFYSDDFTLDEAVQKYQAAHKIAQEIEQDLVELKNEVEVLEDFTK